MDEMPYTDPDEYTTVQNGEYWDAYFNADVRGLEGNTAGQPVWSMKITPEMKAHFAKGVALSGTGAAVLPGLLNQQQQQQQPQAGLLY